MTTSVVRTGEGRSSPTERAQAVIEGVDAIGLDFVLQLPSSTLAAVIRHLESRATPRTFPVTREEEAIGIASGLALAGKKAALVIQDNGLGNLLTALNTFPLAYHLPVFMVVSRRGGLNEYNSMIHLFCERVEAIADAAGLRYWKLDGRVPIDAWASTITKGFEHSVLTRRPVAVFVDLMGGQP
ncbi:MAG TPA: thiamine pyrophosphate-binding protein [Chloroflexota bacterium]|nr:thiamine pyrophosphate-binding protein [Chloroflexota bacterium]